MRYPSDLTDDEWAHVAALIPGSVDPVGEVRRHGQQLGVRLREPLGAYQPMALRAMAVATRVIGDARCTAIIALLDMAPEHRRPARRDGAHDASLDAPEMTGMLLSKRFAMAAEDIRHLGPS